MAINYDVEYPKLQRRVAELQAKLATEKLAHLECIETCRWALEQIEALDDCTRVNRDMCAENVRLKAKLHAVEMLTRYNCVRGLAGGRAVEPDPTGQFILAEDMLKAIQEKEE